MQDWRGQRRLRGRGGRQPPASFRGGPERLDGDGLRDGREWRQFGQFAPPTARRGRHRGPRAAGAGPQCPPVTPPLLAPSAEVMRRPTARPAPGQSSGRKGPCGRAPFAGPGRAASTPTRPGLQRVSQSKRHHSRVRAESRHHCPGRTPDGSCQRPALDAPRAVPGLPPPVRRGNRRSEGTPWKASLHLSPRRGNSPRRVRQVSARPAALVESHTGGLRWAAWR